MDNIPRTDENVTPQKSREVASPSRKLPVKESIVLLICLLLLAIALYGGVQYKRQSTDPTNFLSDVGVILSLSPTPSPTLPTGRRPESVEDLDNQIYPPTDYGFTQTITLEGIGVRGLFPPNTTVSLEQENLYVISASEADQVTFALKPYDGGGRRAWFQQEYPWASGYQTELFVDEGHSGYLAYAVRQEDIPGPFFYFTVIGDHVLVVSGANVISNNLDPSADNTSVFFTSDIQKFKSFISVIEVVTPKLTELEPIPKMSDLFRWSDTRKTVWQDASLGIRVTAPEWTESRSTRGRDASGKFIYTDWTRSYPDARTDPIPYLSDTVLRTQVTGGYISSKFLTQLPIRFQGKTFTEVANEALIPGGFCASGWKSSKDQCDHPTNYCYTREEVVRNLTLKEETQIGSLYAQLRSMNRDFSNLNDCRSEDVWLIRAANGQYITSEISPDADPIRLESL